MTEYDLEIMCPLEPAVPTFAARIPDFKKWGLRSVEGTRVHLVLVIHESDSGEGLKDGWPEGIVVDVIKAPAKHVTQKINYYYTSHMRPENARWFMRVDDDSITEVRPLMNHLDSSFDHDRDYYIVGPLYYHVQEIEYNIAKSLGFHSWYAKTPYWVYEDWPPHENETSVVSRSAIRRIVEGEKSMEMLNIRRLFPDGAGDHALCLAARTQKIYPISVRFITNNGPFWRLATFGGPLAHVHHICRDKTPGLMKWLDEVGDLNNVNDPLRKQVIEHAYLFVDERRRIRDIQRAFVTFKEPGYIVTTAFDNAEPIVLGVWAVSKDGKLMSWFRWDFSEGSDVDMGAIFESRGKDFFSPAGFEFRRL
jgi:hypothetical protein